MQKKKEQHHHHRHRFQWWKSSSWRRMGKRRKSLLGGLAAILLLVLLGLMYMGLSRLEERLDEAPEDAGLTVTRAEEPERPVLYYDGESYALKDGLLTLLILGIDEGTPTESLGARNTGQADLLVLAVFDLETEDCTLIQLNRDTMTEVPVPDGRGSVQRVEWEQLALAHTYGNGLEQSCENTADAVSRLLYGVEIDNYFALTMDAIPILNDLVGGVTVTVEDDFTGVDETLIQGETVKLDEWNVENFVRARSGMPEDKTNQNRMARQRAYLQGLFESLRVSMKRRGFVAQACDALAEYLVSDCTVTELNDYAKRLAKQRLAEIITPVGEAVRGESYMEFNVDEKALRELVLRVFYEKAE